MAYLGSFSTGLNISSKFPCTTYGDFIIRKSLDEGKCDFTVQHNLAEFQKRPGLVPMLAGFPIPAFHSAKYGIHGVFKRYEKIQEETKNRNLICSELSEDENTIRIFSVTDNSDRKQLVEVEIEFSEISTIEIETEFIKLRNTSKNVEIFQLENEAIELKIFDGQESRKIFVKRNGGLDFFDSNEKKIDKLFEDNVLKFFQIPGLNDEIMILDEGKRIWYGELGTELLRKKTNFEPNTISPTTCPRTLLAAENDIINIVDLRENLSTLSKFFQLPDESEFYQSESLPRAVQTKIFSDIKEKILHLSTIPGRNYSTICSTNFHHFLLDQRIPNIPVLTMPHSILQNDAYNFVTQAMKDKLTGNYIHNFFSLSHTNSSQLSYWPILIDVKENLWSSISSLKILPKHEIIGKYYQNQIQKNGKRFNSEILPKKTRAFCYQNISKNSSTAETGLIFQQMDDGDIWYSNFMMNPMINHEIDPEPLRKLTFEFIQDFYEKADSKEYFLKSTMEDLLPADFQQSYKKHIRVINVIPRKSNLPEMKDLRKTPENFDPIGRLRKVKENVINLDDFKPKMEVDEKDLLGNLILNTWNRTGIAYRKYVKELTDKPIEDEENVDGDVDEQVEESRIPEEELMQIDDELRSQPSNKSAIAIVPDENFFDFGELPC